MHVIFYVYYTLLYAYMLTIDSLGNHQITSPPQKGVIARRKYMQNYTHSHIYSMPVWL